MNAILMMSGQLTHRDNFYGPVRIVNLEHRSQWVNFDDVQTLRERIAVPQWVCGK
jgi:hypothetical protein